MKRSFFLLMVLSVSAAGCSTRGADEGKIALTYTRWGDPSEMDSTKELIGHFMKENPNIVVRLDVVSWEQYWQKMATAVVTKTAQDVWLMSPAYVEQYAAAGHVLDLMPFINADPTFNIDDYFPYAFDSFSFAVKGDDMRPAPFGQGPLYAFTRDYNCSLLYYNRDHFDAIGLEYPTNEWTWDDLVRAAKKLTIDFDGDGITDQWGFYGLNYNHFARFNGGRLLDVENRKSTYRSKEVLDAIRFCRDLVYKHKVHPPPDIQIEGEAFTTGKASMTLSGVWNIRRFNRSKYLWDITSIPTDTRERKRTVVGGGVAHCVYSGTKHPDAAWKLVKFLSDEISQRELARSGTSVPVLKTAAYSEDFLAPFDRPSKEGQKVIFKNLLTVNPVRTYTRGYLEYSEYARDVMQGVWLNARTPEEACRMIDERTDRIIAEQYRVREPVERPRTPAKGKKS